MADISSYLNKIRTAIYGKDVRSSIADGIDSINKEVEGNTKHVNDTSTDIQNFKNEINQAETIRVQDENERKSSESNRVNEFNSIKNQFGTLKNNSTEATKNANNAASNANSTATNSENRTSQAINDLTTKVNSAIVDVKANQIGGVNLLDNTDLANPISMFNNTGNIQLIVDKSFQEHTSIYNRKLIGLQSFGETFGDSYASLFKTNDRIIQPNTTYTISFNYMSLHSSGDISSSCFLYFNKNDGTQEVLYLDVDLTSHGANWFKYIKTFTTPSNIRNIEVRFGFRCTAFSWLAIDGVKLEKGTMATDQSPSPFDWKKEIGNGTNLLSSSNCILTKDRIAFPVVNLNPNTMYTLNMNDFEFDGSCLNLYKVSCDYTNNNAKPIQTILDWGNIKGVYTFETNSLIPNEELYFVFWGGGIENKYVDSNKKIKLEEGSVNTPFCFSSKDLIEVGGTNLLNINKDGIWSNITPMESTCHKQTVTVNSPLNNGITNESPALKLWLDDGTSIDSSHNLFRCGNVINEKCNYTFGAWVKTDINKSLIFEVDINDLTAKYFTATDQWQFISYTIKNNVLNSTYNFLDLALCEVGVLYVFHPKLEKGTVNSDFSLPINYFDNKLDTATIDNAPDCKDCNWFLEPNSSFIWDTGLGEFKNTPLGNLAKGSGIVFEVINYGSEGRIQQEFRKTYPLSETRTWIRSYSSDNGGQWTGWKSEFIGENQVGPSDDFNNLTRMGCWKVQSIDSNTPNSPLKLNSNIYNFRLLNVYESGVAEEHRILQIYYPHMPGGVGHRTPLIRMLNSGSWTAWDYIGATSKDIADLKDSCTTLSTKATSNRNDINTHTQQIANNSGAIQEIKNYWLGTGENRLCINGRSEIDVYPGGVYFITGTSVTELHSITHSNVADGQSIFFVAETVDQTANIKFCHDDLVHCGVYAPAGKDFWITGRDNGDTIFEMKKMNGTLRFIGMR